MSGVPLWGCASCAAAFYPPPLRCPRCGGAEGRAVEVHDGVLEEATTVHRSVDDADGPPRYLATVALPEGQRIIAALEEPLPPGSAVALRESDGAVHATRA